MRLLCSLLSLSSCQCIDDHRFAPSSWTNDHACMPSQHRFVQLNNLVSLVERIACMYSRIKVISFVHCMKTPDLRH